MRAVEIDYKQSGKDGLLSIAMSQIYGPEDLGKACDFILSVMNGAWSIVGVQVNAAVKRGEIEEYIEAFFGFRMKAIKTDPFMWRVDRAIAVPGAFKAFISTRAIALAIRNMVWFPLHTATEAVL